MADYQTKTAEKQSETESKKSKHKKIIVAMLSFTIFLLAFYFCVGVFLVQPIGAIPDGTTVLYWRFATNMPFISSADGILLDNGQKVSLLGRGIVLGKVSELMERRKILTFPYSRALYLISTGGREFEK